MQLLFLFFALDYLIGVGGLEVTTLEMAMSSANFTSFFFYLFH